MIRHYIVHINGDDENDIENDDDEANDNDADNNNDNDGDDTSLCKEDRIDSGK